MLERNVKRRYLTYIAVGIMLSGAILFLTVGIVRGRDAEFVYFYAIMLGGGGISIFLSARNFQKMFSIISKLKRAIKDLEEV